LVDQYPRWPFSSAAVCGKRDGEAYIST